jgi:hypothetical protein
MPIVRRLSAWSLSTLGITGWLALSAVLLSGQTSAPQAPANQGGQPACGLIADTDIPLSTTIRAKVTGTLEAAHLKPGKEIWVNAVYGEVFSGCTLEADAAIYAHVTAALSSKNPNASELSLQFDRADCRGHSKQNLKLWLIGVIAPADDSQALHDAVPSEVRGGARQISDTVADTNAYDARLSHGGPPHTVRPGTVIGLKDTKLEPQGGPGCSARMSSTNRNIQLGPGTVLLLAVPSTE